MALSHFCISDVAHMDGAWSAPGIQPCVPQYSSAGSTGCSTKPAFRLPDCFAKNCMYNSLSIRRLSFLVSCLSFFLSASDSSGKPQQSSSDLPLQGFPPHRVFFRRFTDHVLQFGPPETCWILPSSAAVHRELYGSGLSMLFVLLHLFISITTSLSTISG